MNKIAKLEVGLSLDDRKKELLKSIINEYVKNPEPVSSGNIIKKYPIKLSSATIRNEMAELERLGYLEKPYLSSGRIPSNLGYRYFVDELIKEEISEEGILDLEDILKIRNNLKNRINNLEELSKITSATLSEITHYTSVVVGPNIVNDIIESIEFIKLKDDMVMVLIVTAKGLIKESIIKFDDKLTEEMISELNTLFKSKLIGNTLETINNNIEEYIKDEIIIGVDIIKKVIAEINKTLFENYIHVQGEINSLKLPELQEEEYLKEYIKLLGNKEEIIEYIDKKEAGSSGNISIKIAGEDEEIQNFSIITLNPGSDKNIGKISVIAPKRMNYKKVIATMKELLKALNND